MGVLNRSEQQRKDVKDVPATVFHFDPLIGRDVCHSQPNGKQVLSRNGAIEKSQGNALASERICTVRRAAVR